MICKFHEQKHGAFLTKAGTDKLWAHFLESEYFMKAKSSCKKG